MNLLLACLAGATLGIESGWRPLPDGGTEYIIQLDPQTLETLRSGQAIQSDIPPEAGTVRSYRIVVGEGKLPRTSPPQIPQPHVSTRPPSKLPQDVSPEPPPTLEQPPTSTFSENTDSLNQTQPARPWGLLMVALLGLFASLGANAYLGWLLYGCRRQSAVSSFATKE